MTQADRNTDGPRVVYVSPLPPPAGGISTWTRTLTERGLPGGYRVEVVDTSVGPDRAVFTRGSLAAELKRAARILAALGRALRPPRPVLVHLNVDALAAGLHRDLLCGLRCRAAGVPYVVHYRGLVADLAERPERRLQRFSVARLARGAAANLTLNEPSRRFIEQLVGGRSRVVSLPNYYDERALPDASPRARAPGELGRVVFVGGLTRGKGCHHVVATARLRPELEFHLLGRAYPETDALLADAPPNLQIHGEVDHSEVVAQMTRSQALLFPSAIEGFPNAVCEAMALGLPVVASPVGAIPEMVDHGQGGFVLEPSGERLAEALARLFADEGLRLAMGRYNQKKCRRLYSYPRVTERLVEIYRDAVGATDTEHRTR